jgi:hypothetical protein
MGGNGNGEIERQKTYGGSGFDFAHAMQQTQNGGSVGSGLGRVLWCRKDGCMGVET